MTLCHQCIVGGHPANLNLESFQPMTLSQQLKAQTGEAHRAAEKAGIVRELITGKASLQSYALYLYNLQQIYRTLEDALRRLPAQSELCVLAREELYRSRAIARDLDSLSDLVDSDSLTFLPEVHAYRHSIEEAANDNGLLLIAHAYVRYLGDLSGGQILATVLKRSFASVVGGDLSTEFYCFPAIADISEYKIRYKKAIDDLGNRYGCFDSIVLEARQVFELNRQLALAVSVRGA